MISDKPTDDDYIRDGGPGEVRFCVALVMSLCQLELKQILISLLFQVIKALNLAINALRSYLKLTSEYELHTLPYTEDSDPDLPSFE